MVLALWAGCLAFGTALALSIPGPAAAALIVFSGGLATWRAVRRSWVLSIAALAVGLGVSGGLWERPPPSRAPAVAAALAAETAVDVVGTVVRGPERATMPGEGSKSRMRLTLQTLDGGGAQGLLSLAVGGGAPPVAPGDVIRFRARLHEPVGLANPDLPDAFLLARSRGVDLVAGIARPEQVIRVEAGSWASPRRIAFRVRQAMARTITASATAETDGFLRGVVLGERSAISAEAEEGFRAAGATHVLSVSGLHLAAVAALLFLLIRKGASVVPGLTLRFNPGALAAGLSIPAVAFYTLLTGEAVATVRSALMAGVAFAAILVRRPFCLSASIGFAALVLLIEAPLVLLDVSFQLSFLSILALAAFGGWAGAALSPRAGLRARMRGWLFRSAAASTAAALLTAPVVAHHFGEVTPMAPLGNLLIVPLVEMWVVPVGLLGACLGAVSPLAGAVPLAVARWGAELALQMGGAFRRFAPVWLVRIPTWWETALLMLAGALLLWGLGRRWRGERWRTWLLGALFAVLTAGASLVARDLWRKGRDDLRITFLDVGQGDAALVEGPGDFTLLIDGGGTYDGSFDPGERVIEPLLRRRGIRRLDLVALSHPHPDHMNGLHRILERFEVGALWTTGDDGRNPRYYQLLALARARGVDLGRPSPSRTPWGLAVTPVGPWLGDSIAVPPGVSVNDASLVMRVSLGPRSVLFTGDLEGEGEAELAGRGAVGLAIASDVLKVPHHGSRTSSTPDLLDSIRPTLAVISLGRGNRFRFPADEVLASYQERGVHVLRTDRDGAVTVTITRDGALSTTCVRGCR